MQYIAIFENRVYTIKLVKYLRQEGVQCELRAAPRQLSISCGSAVYFSYNGDVKDVIISEVNKIYCIEGKDYTLVYSKN